MDLREPFSDEITLEKDGGHVITLLVKYERLPNICYYCGRVGHVERDCERKEEDEGTYGFGEWMRASPWKASRGGGGKDEGSSSAGRRLVFRPNTEKKMEMTSNIEQMTENLLKISFGGNDTEEG